MHDVLAQLVCIQLASTPAAQVIALALVHTARLYPEVRGIGVKAAADL